MTSLNPIALRKAKIVHNFGLSECNRVKKGGKKGRVFCIVFCMIVSMNGAIKLIFTFPLNFSHIETIVG